MKGNQGNKIKKKLLLCVTTNLIVKHIGILKT